MAYHFLGHLQAVSSWQPSGDGAETGGPACLRAAAAGAATAEVGLPDGAGRCSATQNARGKGLSGEATRGSRSATCGKAVCRAALLFCGIKLENDETESTEGNCARWLCLEPVSAAACCRASAGAGQLTSTKHSQGCRAALCSPHTSKQLYLAVLRTGRVAVTPCCPCVLTQAAQAASLSGHSALHASGCAGAAGAG